MIRAVFPEVHFLGTPSYQRQPTFPCPLSVCLGPEQHELAEAAAIRIRAIEKERLEITNDYEGR